MDWEIIKNPKDYHGMPAEYAVNNKLVKARRGNYAYKDIPYILSGGQIVNADVERRMARYNSIPHCDRERIRYWIVNSTLPMCDHPCLFSTEGGLRRLIIHLYQDIEEIEKAFIPWGIFNRLNVEITPNSWYNPKCTMVVISFFPLRTITAKDLSELSGFSLLDQRFDEMIKWELENQKEETTNA